MNQPKIIVLSPRLVELARQIEKEQGRQPREPYNEFDEQPGPGFYYPGEEAEETK